MAGNSVVKEQGIKAAFSYLFPNTEINVIGSTAPSLINEQPIGYEQAKQGIRNRLVGALDYAIQHGIEYNYVVVIESYLRAEKGFLNVDAALILIQDLEGNISTFRTEPLVLGNEEEVSYDPRTTTLAEALVSCVDSKEYNPKDPHLYFGGKSRSKYIEEAIINHYYDGCI
jgi:hypothetical protein